MRDRPGLSGRAHPGSRNLPMRSPADVPSDFLMNRGESGGMSSSIDPKHTGEAPAHRPPDNEPERVGEGEMDEGPPLDAVVDSRDESGDDEDLLGGE